MVRELKGIIMEWKKENTDKPHVGDPKYCGKCNSLTDNTDLVCNLCRKEEEITDLKVEVERLKTEFDFCKRYCPTVSAEGKVANKEISELRKKLEEAQLRASDYECEYDSAQRGAEINFALFKKAEAEIKRLKGAIAELTIASGETI